MSVAASAPQRLGAPSKWIPALLFAAAVSLRPAAAFSQSDRGAPARQSERFTVEQEFARHVSEVEALLETAGRKLEGGAAVAEGDALLNERDALLALDPAMRQRFEERERQLVAAGVPAVILDRHRATVETYEKHFQILTHNLGLIEKDLRGKRSVSLDTVRAAHRHLKEHKSKDPPDFLSGNSLPLQSAKTKAPVVDISKAVPPPGAAAASAAPAALSQPVPGDLGATIDVQITQDITNLAASLGNSPLRIYQYVRDRFPFEPYLGSRKGSDETLSAGSGNDYDLASLLIALLRAANIPCRYVAGTVLLSADQATAWLGATDPGTAADLLASAGMGATAYTSGSQITAISIQHVWVKAYLPYGNYRGIPNDATGKAWIELDPSFKSVDYPAAPDIPTEMGFNASSFIDSYISTFHTPSPVELYLQQIQTYVTANHPELTYPNDVFRHGTITPEGLGLLPASLPYKILTKDSEYSAIPANKRHQIRFLISDNAGTPLLDQTVNLPEIASKRVTISYVAATPADQATIDTYGDLYSTPPDLIALKPVLKIDGTAVGVGNAIGGGIQHHSDMYFLTPTGEGNSIPVIHNFITAGTYQGIGINTFGVAPSVLLPRSISTPDVDGLTGDKLYRTAMSYLDRVDRSDVAVAQTMQMVFTTAVSEAIVENVLLVSYSFGVPVAWQWRGLIVDADRKIIGPFSITGDTTKEKPFFVLTGADGSISENRLFEDLYNEQAVSTIKILELANDMSVPACRIVTSIAADCPSLSQPASVVNAINAALGQGHTVTIPRAAITYHQWSGTGYIDMDPVTGAAGYIISGGQSGGATVDLWVSPWLFVFTVFRDLCPANPIAAVITYPNSGKCFPALGFLDFLSDTDMHFDVTYTICYDGDGTREVSEVYTPHYPYPQGQYVFDAGWGTGQTVDFSVYDVRPDKDPAMKYGYDGTVDGEPAKVSTGPHWVSTMAGDTTTALANTTPATCADQVKYTSDDTGIATVSPSQGTNSPETLTLTGVSASHAGAGIKANTVFLKAAPYASKTLIVAITPIDEENDDVQQIPVGKGDPHAAVANTGVNGVCETTAGGDDVQVIPVGKGTPFSVAIQSGPDGIRQSAPVGDDTIVGSSITTGPDGVCNTPKSGDDVQVIAVGKGLANQVAVDSGADGVSQTTKGGDDAALILSGNGKPNTACVGAGPNAFRDTATAVGDDAIVGNDITTGADGICNTKATSTDVPSGDTLIATAVETYFDKVYKQAVESFVVYKNPAKRVNYDLNRDGALEDNTTWPSTEANAIYTAAADPLADLNLFVVGTFSSTATDGTQGEAAGIPANRAYFRGAGACNVLNVITHESGHCLGLAHPSNPPNPKYAGRLMYNYCNVPSQGGELLVKPEWDHLNP